MRILLFMFTGIVQEKGKVISFEEGPQSWRLTIEARALVEDLAIGDSVAVNGCCLTAAGISGAEVSFDLLSETVRLTSFSGLRPGDLVNLEGSLRFNGKLGGHFVSGHIDGVGEVETIEERGRDLFLRIRPPAGFARYLVHKGSIALAGVSLTVAEIDETGFAVWLIPHTLQATNLGTLRPGAQVNLEFDLLGKYVERLLAAGNIPSGT